MTISLISLPYPAEALEPYISKRTLELHHGAHHKDYVDKTNKAIAVTGLADRELNDIVKAAVGQPGLFNSASQAWNHGFYWNSMTPDGSRPSDRLSQAIDRDFGSIEKLKQKLSEEAVAHFASGWIWLVAEGDRLCVVPTHDAHSPLSEGGANPLLTIDVWEHAYYLDVQNKRADYVKALVGHCLNWNFASENYARASVWRYPADEMQKPAFGFETAG
jgi:Fe-Mn family superoxide dismutase